MARHSSMCRTDLMPSDSDKLPSWPEMLRFVMGCWVEGYLLCGKELFEESLDEAEAEADPA
jgi:hypothetical protein